MRAVVDGLGDRRGLTHETHETRPIRAPTGLQTDQRVASSCPRQRSSGAPLPRRLHDGPAPVRRFLPELIDLIWNRQINPGKVFDLELPLDQSAEGYRAIDEQRAIKVLLRLSRVTATNGRSLPKELKITGGRMSRMSRITRRCNGRSSSPRAAERPFRYTDR
jgi:hypothetical protein